MHRKTVDETEAAAGAQKALALTRELIRRFGPRPAGSPASRGCAEALKKEAEEFSDDVRTTDFLVHPGAFLGWIRVLVAFYLVGTAASWGGFTLVSSILRTVGLLIMVLQFFLYIEILDPFFPKRRGRNVSASVEPTGETRGELIVSGHHDSARVFNFFVHQPSLYALRVLGGIGSLVLLFIMSWILTILRWAGGNPHTAVRVTAIVFSALFLLVGQLWWFAARKHTQGAGDNLASSAAAWEFLRETAAQSNAGIGHRHLKVTAVSWDAEEAGLRGARAWRRRRSKSDEGSAIPTTHLNLECLYNAADFFLLSSDINGSVRLSRPLAERCSRLLGAAGHPEVPVRPIEFLTGGTDAAETARAGVEATTLMGMPWGNSSRAAVYHTPDDVADAVDPEAVAAAISLAGALARELDSELAMDDSFETRERMS